MYIINPRTTTKREKRERKRSVTNNPIVEIKWNHKKYSTKKKTRKKEKWSKATGQIEIQDNRLKPNHIYNHIKCKWSNAPIKR